MFQLNKNHHNKWDMILPPLSLPPTQRQGWGELVDACVVELDDQIAVRRTSYDTWEWLLEEDARQFITYFTLKYGVE